MMAAFKSDPPIDADHTSLDFAVYFDGGKEIHIYESGVPQGAGFGTAVVSGMSSIERIGTAITYKKNGTVFYTSATTCMSVLRFEASLFTPMAKIHTICMELKQATSILECYDDE